MSRAQGWWRFYRSLADEESDLWNSRAPFCPRSAWVDLINMARFADGDVPDGVGGQLYLKRGEFFASIRWLARRWGWKKDRVLRYLNSLANAGRIARQREQLGGCVYLVVNYELYQCDEIDTRQQVRQERDSRATKNKKERTKTTTHVLSIDEARDRSHDPDLAEFAHFWDLYPRRMGTNSPSAAEKQWLARRRQGVSAAAMIDGVRRYRAHCEREQIIGAKFVMQASRFLGTERHFEHDWGVELVHDVDGVPGSAPPLIPGARDAEDARKLRLAGF